MSDLSRILDTPETVPAATPPRLSPAGHRLAILRPAHRKQVEATVELIARTSRGLIVIRIAPAKPGGKPTWSSVYSFRLIDAATRRPLKRADFTDLPWQGSGPDPDVADNKE